MTGRCKLTVNAQNAWMPPGTHASLLLILKLLTSRRSSTSRRNPRCRRNPKSRPTICPCWSRPSWSSRWCRRPRSIRLLLPVSGNRPGRPEPCSLPTARSILWRSSYLYPRLCSKKRVAAAYAGTLQSLPFRGSRACMVQGAISCLCDGAKGLVDNPDCTSSSGGWPPWIEKRTGQSQRKGQSKCRRCPTQESDKHGC